jgi:hypothetical protein
MARRPRNTAGALLTLAAGAGWWAWQNRNKIRGYLDQQRSTMQSGNQGSFSQPTPMTGETRRIDSIDTLEQPKYDASI